MLNSDVQTVSLLVATVSILVKIVYDLLQQKKKNGNGNPGFNAREVETVLTWVTEKGPNAVRDMERTLQRMEDIMERQTTLMDRQTGIQAQQGITMNRVLDLVERIERGRQ